LNDGSVDVASPVIANAPANIVSVNPFGQLTVNGSVIGNVRVLGGGTLNGSGTIFGNLSVAPIASNNFGGTISPGNSPGTLTGERQLHTGQWWRA
jgi:hypothetical protein